MSVVKKFLTDTAIYGLSTIVSRLLNFILTPLFLKKFEAKIYGVFTNMYSWAAMINALLAFGMETTYFRYLQKVEDTDRPKVFNNSFIVTLFSALLFTLLLLTFSGYGATWFASHGEQSIQDYHQYIYLMGFTLVADALAVVPFAKVRSQNRPIRYGYLKMVNIVVFVLSNVFFIVFLPWFLKAFPSFQGYFLWHKGAWLGYVFLSNLIASVLTLVMLFPEWRSFHFRMDKKLMKSMFSYSFPILLANLSFIVNEHLDKILMPTLLPDNIGERDLGIYGAISKIAVFLSIFVQAFRLGAEPFFFSYAKNENAKRIYATIMEYFVIAMMLVMVGLSLNIEWLKYFIEGKNATQIAEYWSGLNYIPLILFNFVLLGIYMNLSVWYKLSDQTRYGLYISVAGAFITVGFCLLLIPLYSYVGAIIVTTVTYLLMIFLSYYWGQRKYPIPYKVGKMVVHIAIGSTLVALNYLLFERNVWIGNILFLFYILLVFISEKKFVFGLLGKR